jgi:hypothetical protein
MQSSQCKVQIGRGLPMGSFGKPGVVLFAREGMHA